MLTVTASEDGVARAQLVSSKMVGTARVGASVEGVASLAPRQIEVRFVPVDVSAIIRLSVSSSTAPADGTTRIQVFADVNRPGATVSFTTNRGRFVGTTNPMTGTAVANAAGRAVVDLVSSDIGPARLSATVESTTVETEVEFEPVDDTRIIQIGVSDSDRKVPADGETVTQVYAVVVPGTAQVMFTTSLGKFASGSTTATIPVGPGNRAVADLVSHDKVSTTRLTATVNGQHTAETTLDFVRALPDRLIVLLGASELEASPTKSVTVTVRLLRDIGTVTDNTVVEYQALDADAEPEKDLHFTFRNKEPSKNGVATAEVVAGSTTFREVAKIRATTDGEEKPVSGEENIQIINPKQ